MSDSKEVVEAINHKLHIPGCWAVLKEIEELLNQPWEVRVEHEFREPNRSADLLAAISIRQEVERKLCRYPPEVLKQILCEDREGVSFLHRVGS